MPFAADRIAITGATGFIGRALVANLLADRNGIPRLFGRSSGTLAGCPVRPLELLHEELTGIDTVVHLAAITTSRVSSAILQQANVDLAVDTAKAAAASGVKRFIFLSTLGVHGKSSGRPVGPDAAFKEDNGYGGSKIAAEKALADIAEETGLELTVIRPPMVYGPGGNGSFDLLARLIRTGLPLPFADARGKRSFCSLANVVAAIRHSINASGSLGVLIPADPEDFDTADLTRAMAAVIGKRAWLWSIPRPMLELPFALIGRQEMIVSLFDTLRVDRSHWELSGWQPLQTGYEGIQAALTSEEDRDGGSTRQTEY